MAQRLMTDRLKGKQFREIKAYLDVSDTEVDDVFATIYAWLIKQGRPFTSDDLCLIAKTWSDASAEFVLEDFLSLLPSDMTGVLAAWRAGACAKS